MKYWYDGTRRTQINKAMRDAWDAMDRAYHHSDTDADLIKHTAAASKALAEVRRHSRANRHTT